MLILSLFSSLVACADERSDELPALSTLDSSSGTDADVDASADADTSAEVDTSETEADEDLPLATFSDGPNLDQEVAVFLNDNALDGEFTLVRGESGWALYGDRFTAAVEDDSEGVSEVGGDDVDDGPQWAASYWYDTTSGSSTSASCSGSLALLEDVTFSSATAGLYYTGGANQVQVAGSWSGCQSSGGSLVVAQTVTGTGLSVSVGFPSGVSVSTSTTSKFQWTDTVTPSSRKASFDGCFTGVDGFLTGRVTTASLTYYVSAGSKKVLSVSKTSWYWRDAWAAGTTC